MLIKYIYQSTFQNIYKETHDFCLTNSQKVKNNKEKVSRSHIIVITKIFKYLIMENIGPYVKIARTKILFSIDDY